MEDLWTKVSALAAFLGALIAFVAREVWRRFRGRMVTLRWSVEHYRVAVASSDDRSGKLEVLYNGQSVGNIQGCILELENDSSEDLTDVELNLFYTDRTIFLSGEGGLVGSTQTLPLTNRFLKAAQRVQNLPPEERPQDPDFHYLLERRDFLIPVLNRGARVEFRFLVTPSFALSAPTLSVSCDHKGVRLRNRPLQEMFWGEPRLQAAYIGLVEAALLAGVAGVTIASPIWASVVAFVLGAFCIVFGTLSLKLNRFLRRTF